MSALEGPSPRSRVRHGGDLRRLIERRRLLVARHGHDPAEEEIVDFSANINPLGPPLWLRPVVARALDRVEHYPDPDMGLMRDAVAARWGVDREAVICGPGTDELMRALVRAIRPSLAVIPVPSYATYREASEAASIPVEEVAMTAPDFRFPFDSIHETLRSATASSTQPVMVWCGSPNNPTGGVPDGTKMRTLTEAFPNVVFVFDEAFAPFVSDEAPAAASDDRNVVSLRSLTKVFAIPGIRVGYAVAPPPIAGAMRHELSAWPLSCVAEAVGSRCIADSEHPVATRALIDHERQYVTDALERLDVAVTPGAASFLLVRHSRFPDLADALLVRGIAVRECGSFPGLSPSYARIAIRTREDNDRLIDAFAQVLAPATGEAPASQRTSATSPARAPRAAALMLQGTASNVGKSILTAALCRVLLQDGYTVAPFKAQNMALNSFVTLDGGEIGRAQAVQAQACRLEPDVVMNPVLLKPSSDVGSQIVLMGKPAGFLGAARFAERRERLWSTVRAAYDRLSAEYDVVVIEGAGSPAEVNLKATEFVNMGTAEYADATVYLVGDIDRGGVYAAFIGTMETFSNEERRRVGGFIVNKFRGDATLLTGAHDYVFDSTGKRVIGVVPYLGATGIPDEDSVSFKEEAPRVTATTDQLRIALVNLPHISNFTDIDALRVEPDVFVARIDRIEELAAGGWDLVIVPGSKNVFSDLAWLRRTGIAAWICDHAADTPIAGICGGLQMLGSRIDDPGGFESSEPTTVRGLGLIPIITTFAESKTLSRVTARHVPTGTAVTGYEIHHGVSHASDAQACFERSDGVAIGWRATDSLAWGTYLHGLFDADGFRRELLDELRTRRGWSAIEHPTGYSVESAIDRVADVFRQSVNMDEIYRALDRRRRCQ